MEGIPPITEMPSAVNFCTTVFIRQWMRSRTRPTFAKNLACLFALIQAHWTSTAISSTAGADLVSPLSCMKVAKRL